MREFVQLVIKSVSELYYKFILRDVFSIMLPGFIVAFVLSLLLRNIIASICLFEKVIAYFVSIQFFRVWLALLFAYPIGWVLNQIPRFWEKDKDTYFEIELRFFESVELLSRRGIVDKEKELIYRERVKTAKQMIENLLYGFLVCLISWLVFEIPFFQNKIFFVLFVAAFSFVVLPKISKIMSNNLEIWEKSRIDYSNRY